MSTTSIGPLLQRGSRRGRGGAPAAPRHLSAHSRATWRALHAEFALSLAATELLRMALEARDLHDEARAQIAQDGLLMASRYAGVPRAHPLVAVQRDAARTFERICRALDLQLAEDAGAGVPGRGGRPAARAIRPGMQTPRLLAAVGDEP